MTDKRSEKESNTTDKIREKVKYFMDRGQKQLDRIPLSIPLMATFGLVATFYGFEKFLDQTVLVEQLFIMIVLDIFLLLITGKYVEKL